MARGVIVVHGIGQQRKGDTLVEVVNPIADFLERRGGTVRRSARIDQDHDRPPEAVLRVTLPDGSRAEEWVFREAYWAASFRPPSLGAMLAWGGHIIGRQIEATRRILQDPANRVPGPSAEGLSGEEAPMKFPRWVRAWFWVRARSQMAAMWLVRRLSWLLLLAVWLVARVPRVAFLRGPLDALEELLDPFLVQGLGDAMRFVEHGLWAASMRGALERELLRFLDDQDCQSVTVIAHSLGASIAYDALTEGGEVDRFLRAHPEKTKPLVWVTVGPALNRTLMLAKSSLSPQARPRFTRPIARAPLTPPERFYWLYIYGRYDPVSLGAPTLELRDCLDIPPHRIKERMVINRDSLLADHTTYWENEELVLPRLVRAVYGGEYPWEGMELGAEENLAHIRARTIRVARSQIRLVAVAAGVLAAIVIAGVLYPWLLPLVVVYGLGLTVWARRGQSSTTSRP